MNFLTILQGALVVILALIPAIVWFKLWKGRNVSNLAKKYMLLAFGLGALSVFPVFLVHYIWQTFPQTDVINMIARFEIPQKEKIIILFIIVAIIEEIAKFLVILFIDKSKNLVNSIHDAIKYGIVAALGFAFAENIYYFYNVGLNIEIYQFLALFAFRSVITVCGHLVFSGIFGNFYGMSKFAKSFATQKYWGNMKKLDKRALSDEELEKKAELFKRLTIAKGLFFAVTLHALFNLFLELGMISKVLWLITVGLIFLVYLYKRRSGYLELLYKRSKFSHMQDRDKDVVLELLGTWYREGKYIEVIKTCKRLLKRDPTNPVVRLFLSKAVDSQRFVDAYSAIRRLFVRKNYLEDFDIDEWVSEEEEKKEEHLEQQ